MSVPYTFAGQAGPLPLSELDADFAFLGTGSLTYLTDSSVTPNVVTVTLPTPSGVPVIAYAPGLLLLVQVANTITSTTPTINVNTLGAKTIVNADGSALIAGQITAGTLVELVYDGTNFRLISTTNKGGASGTFAVAATGFSSGTTTGVATWRIIFNIAVVNLPTFVGTSNSTSFTITGIPAFLVPATCSGHFAVGATDNGSEVGAANCQVLAGSNVYVYANGGSVTGWTPTGGKAGGFCTLTYLLD
jgi:hypothetical protein